jgi:hypothetical protein
MRNEIEKNDGLVRLIDEARVGRLKVEQLEPGDNPTVQSWAVKYQGRLYVVDLHDPGFYLGRPVVSTRGDADWTAYKESVRPDIVDGSKSIKAYDLNDALIGVMDQVDELIFEAIVVSQRNDEVTRTSVVGK